MSAATAPLPADACRRCIAPTFDTPPADLGDGLRAGGLRRWACSDSVMALDRLFFAFVLGTLHERLCRRLLAFLGRLFLALHGVLAILGAPLHVV